MWVLYAFLSALLETTKDVVGKRGSQRTNEYITAFSIQLFESIILFFFLLYFGFPHVKPIFWWILIGFCFTIPSASILYMRAIKLSPLSISVPMLAFNPVITALLAIFFDRKFPTPLGWVGIVLVCIGLYCLRLERDTLYKGVLYPIRKIKDDPGAYAMLGVAFIWAIGAHLSTAVVHASSPLFAVWAGTVVGSIILFIIAKRIGQLSWNVFQNHAKQLIFLGIIDGFSNIAMYTALTTGLTPYVITIKRTNILWSSLMGKFVYGETLGKIKLFGLIIMIAGIISILIK